MAQERFASCSLRDFILEEELSRGAHGTSIWRVRFKYDGKKYVLKEIKLSGKTSQRAAFKEAELLRQLDHRNCIHCYGHFVDDINKLFYIILEYCDGGDLLELINQHKGGGSGGNAGSGGGSGSGGSGPGKEGKRVIKYLNENYIWKLFNQICLGVQHLHQMGIVHRDLKTSNIFLVDHCTPKIGDLGVSYQVNESSVMLQTFSGTPLYLSPELVRGQPYNEKTDIWSLGIVLYELCALTPPFLGTTLLELAQAIDGADLPPLPACYSSKMTRLINWLLQRDYSQRPSITQVVEKISKHLLTLRDDDNGAGDNNNGPGQRNNPGRIETSPPHSNSQPTKTAVSSNPPPVSSDQPHSRKGHEGGIDEVVVDLHRLTILEKREKLTLQKLIQTRTLTETSTATTPLSTGTGAGTGAGRGGGATRPGAGTGTGTGEGESSRTKDLNEQIKNVQQKLELLEQAISCGGHLERANAERLGLHSGRGAEEEKRPGPGQGQAQGREDDENPLRRGHKRHPIPEKTDHPSPSPSSSSSPQSANVKVQTSLPGDDRPADKIFQNERQRQSLFIPPPPSATATATATVTAPMAVAGSLPSYHEKLETKPGKQLFPNVNSNQAHSQTTKQRATSSGSGSSSGSVSRFNIITGREF